MLVEWSGEVESSAGGNSGDYVDGVGVGGDKSAEVQKVSISGTCGRERVNERRVQHQRSLFKTGLVNGLNGGARNVKSRSPDGDAAALAALQGCRYPLAGIRETLYPPPTELGRHEEMWRKTYRLHHLASRMIKDPSNQSNTIDAYLAIWYISRLLSEAPPSTPSTENHLHDVDQRKNISLNDWRRHCVKAKVSFELFLHSSYNTNRQGIFELLVHSFNDTIHPQANMAPSSKRIVFTGGSGKAGRHVIPALQKAGHKVFITMCIVSLII